MNLIGLCLIPVVLVALWFSDGLILGTAEAEIPFYNLESFHKKTAYTWTDFYLGRPTSLTIASAPTWWLLAQLQNIGIPGFLIQAFIFWLILTLSGVGMYKLTKAFFPALPKKYLVLSSLFYWFNPVTLVNVWNRFLYNYMALYAILPFLILLYIKGLEQKKNIFAVAIPLLLGFFSYALTGYVFNLLIFFLFVITWLFLLFTNFKKELIFFSIKFNLIIFFGFLIVNTWWILPTSQFLRSKDTAQELSSFVTSEGNLYTLNILSKKLGNLIDITRLTHIAFFQNEGPEWAHIYISFPLDITLFFSSLLLFWGIYASKNLRWGLYLSFLFLTAVFLAKGNEGPFGSIFELFFKRFSIVQIFRDPFEKFSFILSLAAAPLFAVGVQRLEENLKEGLRFLPSLLALIIIIILGFPFFSELVFTSQTPPNNNYTIGYKVKVPDYYAQADSWFKSQGNNFRFIGFPLGGEGITYNWEKGYQGVESGEILFSTPNILFNTTIPYYSQIADKLERLLVEEENFFRVANLLNSRYLLLRSDVNIGERRLRDPKFIEDLLNRNEKKGSVKRVAQFGKLTIWENLSWVDKTVYVANNPIFTSPLPEISDILLSRYSEDALLSSGLKTEIKIGENSTIIHPKEEKTDNLKQEIPGFERVRKYQFNTDDKADYELILNNVNLSESEATLAGKIRIEIDKKEISNNKTLRRNNKISYGQIALSKGEHQISIERPITENLISTPDTITLKTLPDQNKASFQIRDFDAYGKYLVGFDYLIKSGKGFSILFHQNNDLVRQNNIIPEAQYYNLVTQKSSPNSFIHANGGYIAQKSDSASLLFLIDPSPNSEVVLNNLVINRLIESSPVLVKDASNSTLPSSPQVIYTKHNPTKYSVSIKGASHPFILVFSELFNSGWEARLDDGTLVKPHFLANAYANGWIVNKEGDFKVTLEFTPQRLLDIGKIISGVSLTGGLIYIGSALLGKRKD